MRPVPETDALRGRTAANSGKSNTGLLHMLQTSNANNQTSDVKVIRNQYAHGDTYVYYCDFNYMGNVHSAAGDENGNCYGAFIRSLDNNFQGVVEAFDAAILFQQPHAEQPIKWHYGHAESRAPRRATLTVSKVTGRLRFDGGGVSTGGPGEGDVGLDDRTVNSTILISLDA